MNCGTAIKSVSWMKPFGFGPGGALSGQIASLPKEPMMSDPLPDRPFVDTSADLFSYAGKHYLVYADRFSGWPEVHVWKFDPSAGQVATVIEEWFVDHGVPHRFRSDGGPQFAAKRFTDFLKEWHVAPAPSTPHYPQSNGHAESVVKSMKMLIRKSCPNGDITATEFRRALLEFRNTPRQHGRDLGRLRHVGCE
jgi:transposase InsO family protein